MQAREFMTKEVVSVPPETPTREIARILLEHGVSAVPVIDRNGVAIGMVSEGDLLGRGEADRQARRDWWLTLLAEGQTLNPQFLASLGSTELTARDVMTAPVVRITETAEASEITRLLQEYRIKRVPVVRDGHVVGIVSRADLLRAFDMNHLDQSSSGSRARPHGLLTDVVTAIDHRFGHRHDTAAPGAPRRTSAGNLEPLLTVANFRELTADFEHRKIERRDEMRRSVAEQSHWRVGELIDHHIGEEDWRSILHRAREAAARGEKQFMLLRFPTELCTDHGRAINAPLANWPETLRGEAAEIYLRWERDLKPGGFHLAARVLDFPGGYPGEAGLFLVWGD